MTTKEIVKTGRMPRTSNTLLEATDTATVLKHLAYRHRVGLLMASTVTLLVYIVTDKIISIFS